MDDFTYDQRLTQLGQLRDRLQRLEGTDYMTAYYKGYSNSGATLAEIQDELAILQTQINALTDQLDDENFK